MVTAIVMLPFGINFNLYFFLLIRHFQEAFASEEMWVYLGVIVAFHPYHCGQYLPLVRRCVAFPAPLLFPGVFHHYHHGLCHSRF